MCAATGSRGRSAPARSRRRRPAGALEPESALERILAYRFDDAAILQRSLVHRSYLNEVKADSVRSNERLEFLGDAVIQLTELRSHLVRWETLGQVAARLGLGEYLVLGRGEERAGARARPMTLARAYEAVVGAIHEDGGIARAHEFILRSLGHELDSLQATTDVADVKSRLQTRAQAELGTLPAYRTVHVSGPAHERIYRVEVSVNERVLGTGEGRNKRGAERAAAEQALQQLEEPR